MNWRVGREGRSPINLSAIDKVGHCIRAVGGDKDEAIAARTPSEGIRILSLITIKLIIPCSP